MGKTTALCHMAEISNLVLQLPTVEASEEYEHSVEIENATFSLFTHEIDVYITPKAEHIDASLSLLCDEADAVILFIDHSQKNALEELEVYIKRFIDHLDNIVIAVTHTDLDSQQLLKKYRNWLQMYDYAFPIFAIDARQKADLELLLDVLIARTQIAEVD